jgi:hypothetical protein
MLVASLFLKEDAMIYDSWEGNTDFFVVSTAVGSEPLRRIYYPILWHRFRGCEYVPFVGMQNCAKGEGQPFAMAIDTRRVFGRPVISMVALLGSSLYHFYLDDKAPFMLHEHGRQRVPIHQTSMLDLLKIYEHLRPLCSAAGGQSHSGLAPYMK